MILTSIIPDLPGLGVDNIENSADHITIHAHSNTTSAVCPLCGNTSQRVNSTYCRHPTDLPCIGKRLRLVLTVRRFFCVNQACKRKTFVERLPFLAAYAQRTDRLNKALGVLALGMSAEAGSRTVKQLGMPVSGDTLLRIVRRLPLPAQDAPRVIGIDDWVYRKGHNYGTIICDLEHSAIIDLLPDRDKPTVVDWLKQHPSIEIVSRDRATGYRDAAQSGAPQAMQVADRWHLLKNLFDCTKEVLDSYRGLLKDISQEPQMKETWAKLQDKPMQATTVQTSDMPLEDEVVEGNPKHKDLPPAMRRRIQHGMIHRLRAQGVPIKSISQLTGLSRASIYRYLKVNSLPVVNIVSPPEVKVPRRPRQVRYQQIIQLRAAGVTIAEIVHRVGYSRATVYRILKMAGKSNLIEREYAPPRKLRRWMGRFNELWNAGNHDLQSLWQILNEEGYGMTFASIRRAVNHRYQHLPMSAMSAEPRKRFSPRWAAWLFVSEPTKLEPYDYRFLLFAIKTSPALLQLYALVQAFQRLITQKRSLALFEHCLKCASQSPFPEFQRFANGLTDDQAAVQAALVHKWNNGPVEGQVSRLKLVRRQMYGRGKLDLLKQRLLCKIG